MEKFIEEIDNEKLKNKLYIALQKRKPFRNFKWEIDYSGEYRQKWFDYKNQKYRDFVKHQGEVLSN